MYAKHAGSTKWILKTRYVGRSQGCSGFYFPHSIEEANLCLHPDSRTINTSYINKIKKSKGFSSNKFTAKGTKVKAVNIIKKANPDFRFVDFKRKQFGNYFQSNGGEKSPALFLSKQPKLNRCQSFVQKPILDKVKVRSVLSYVQVANAFRNGVFSKYLSKDTEMF